jgi:hypothetical protein
MTMASPPSVVLASLLLSVAALAGQAQPGPPQGGRWDRGPPYGPAYDPKTVETTSGEITSVEMVPPLTGMWRGVSITLKTVKGETLPVHLGPRWYIDQQPIKLAKGDQIRVRGSRVTNRGKPAIIAAELIKDGQTMYLRDDAGEPAWIGGRQGTR